MESSNEKDVRQQQDSDLESNADSSADSNAEIKKTLSALNTNMASITTFLQALTEGKLQVGHRPCLPTGHLLSTGQNQMQDPPSDGLPTGHLNPAGTSLSESKTCKKRMGDDSASSSAPIKQARTFDIDDDPPHDSISILASDDELESDTTFEPIEPSTLLQHLGEDLETDEKTSADVTQELAAIVNKRWGKHLSPEKLKAISEKYNRPANCKEMHPQIKVNKEVWSFLLSDKKSVDTKISNIQQTIQRVGCIIVDAANYLLMTDMGDQQDAPSAVVTKLVDGIALLGHATNDLSCLRRNALKAAVKPEYKALTSRAIDHSQYLFGSDFTKELKEAEESSKVSKAFHSLRPNDNKFRNKPGQSNQFAYNKRNDFLYRGRSRPPFRKRNFYQQKNQNSSKQNQQNQRNAKKF